MLKEAGAAEVHMRIASPASKGACFYGVDTPNPEELIASRMSVDEICEYIEADSLAYISIEGMANSIKDDKNDYCFACFDGEYPIK